MAGIDNSSVLEILQAHFGHAASSEANKEEAVLMEEEKTSEVVEEILSEPREVGNLATDEFIFPIRSSPLVVAGIPKMYLLLCGPKTLSHCHCHVPTCTLDFTQKVTACNHVHHGHLNVALVCLYCSFKSNPKMHWYSASAWEHHSIKHLER